MKTHIIHINPEDVKFEDLAEFKWVLSCGSEIIFNWKGHSYSVGFGGKLYRYGISESYNEDYSCDSNDIEDILNFKLHSGDKVRDIITQAEIIDRTL